MIVSNIAVNSGTPENITIGRRGTYNTQEVTFDLSYLLDNYGDGTAVLMVKRSQDDTAYPAVTTQEEAKLTWVISDADTAYKGNGECELFWYVDGGLAKSVIYPLTVMRDIGETTEEPPDAYQTWVDHLTELGEETLENAQNAAQSATNAKESETNAANSATEAKEAAEMLTDVSATATTLEPGSKATAKYNNGVFEFGIPKGEKGDKLTYADLTEADKRDLVQGPIKEAQDDAVEAVESAESTALQSINTAGTAAVNAVNQAGETQTARVNTAGQTQTNAVNQAGTTQVNAVNTAGETQVQAVEDKGTEVLDSIPDDYTELSNKVNDPVTGLDTKAPVILNTASGDIASFSDGADSMPIKSLIANIEPVQDLHGYDYPWPAGGGKNKYNGADIIFVADASATTLNGITLTKNSDGSFTVVGTATAETRLNTRAAYDFKAGKSYTISARGLTDGNIRIIINSNASGSGLDYTSEFPSSDFSRTYTIRADCGFAYFFIDVQNGATVNNTIRVQIEEGQLTDWTPYSNICPISGRTGMNLYHAPEYDAEAEPTLSVTWEDEAGTVYGGTDEVIGGTLTKLPISKITLTGSESIITSGKSGNFFSAHIKSDAFPVSANTEVGWCISNALKTANAQTNNQGTLSNVAINTSGRLIVNVYGATTLQEWRDFFANATTPIEIYYRTNAESQTYQLTPQEVDTLVGQNNVWVDTGSVSVEYPADTKLYIQQLTKPTEDDMTANANIAANKFFMIGNALYYSTAAIAAGATIIPGTNCNAVSLADALNTLNA